MSLRTRVVLAVALTTLAVGAMTIFASIRMKQWHEVGMTGVIFYPQMPAEKQKTQPPIKLFTPGRVFVSYPTAPADRAGIRPGDQLLTINGLSVKDNDALVAQARTLRRGDRVVYRLQRDGKTLDVATVLGSPLHCPLFIASLFVYLLVGGTYLVVGLVILAKRPDDRRVLVFFAMMSVGALYLIGASALSLESSDLRGLYAEATGKGMLSVIALMTVLIAFFPLTLHLALVFPRDRPVVQRSPYVLRWVYGVPAAVVIALLLIGLYGKVAGASQAREKSLALPLNIVAAIVTLAGFALAWWIARQTRGQRLRDALWHRPLQAIFFIVAALLGLLRVASAVDVKWLKIVVGVIFGVGPLLALFSFPVLSCIALYRSYRDAGAEERRQVKWPLWGTISALATRLVIGLITQVVVVVTMLSGGDFGRWFGITQVIGVFTMLVYLLIPISFAVAILKYRLMNIDVIIRKTVVYTALSGVIVVLYLAMVGLLGTALVNLTGVRNQTMVIGATLVVALVFVPIRNKLQGFVERTMFRHKYDYPEALRAIAADALAASDLHTFLASAAEKTQQALQTRSVVIFAPRHDEFFAAAKVGVADALLGNLRVTRSAILASLDRPFDPRRHALSDDATAALKRIEAVLVVPINTPGTPANGFLALAPKLNGKDLDVEDIDFLRSVADQIDIGMDRVRLQREDIDYSQARAIQQTLIPREMPRVEGIDVSGTWQPARTMGGDYYDLLKLSETELAICIGDVAGKGMPAALLMSGLQAAVRASASSSPRDLCERVRRVVVTSLSGGRFVTFFYATVDTAAMTLRWSNAGHNAPILARADGTVVRLEEGGPAISRLFRDTPYVEREIPLTPGDRIVLFTDGVSEASNGNEMFGEERIEELVRTMPEASAETLQQTIVNAAITFAGGEVEDDLTLVCLGVRRR